MTVNIKATDIPFRTKEKTGYKKGDEDKQQYEMTTYWQIASWTDPETQKVYTAIVDPNTALAGLDESFFRRSINPEVQSQKAGHSDLRGLVSLAEAQHLDSSQSATSPSLLGLPVVEDQRINSRTSRSA